MQVTHAPSLRLTASSAVQPPAEPSSEQLARWVAGTAAGDSQAFESLFHAFYDRLCSYAEGYIRSPHAAEEIVDDVFLALWTGRARLGPQTAIASYLYVAVRNRALNGIGRRKLELRYAERAAIEAHDGLQSQRSEVEDDVRSRELYAHAERAIEELPDRMRETYLLYYQHDLSYAEIAGIMRVSVRTVENQLARAVKRLWRALHDTLE